LPKWLKLLWETVLIAYMATLLGTLGAGALCFDASQNLKRSHWVSRRALEVFRTIPDLVYALIFVFAFGIGPLAGVLAIAVHSMGGNGKLFAEAVENIDMKPVDGLRSAGANWAQTIRYAVMSQGLPNFTTFTLWRFEINVRAASVVGFVGAGGIGQEFYTAIRMLYYEDISALIIILVVTVMVIEDVERKQVDGVRACSGNSLQTIRFGILPQVLPVMLSNALYIFELNTRSATILGIVGAGGIGFYLADRIRTLLWEEAWFIMILILVAVYLIDWFSKLLRARLIHGRGVSGPVRAHSPGGGVT